MGNSMVVAVRERGGLEEGTPTRLKRETCGRGEEGVFDETEESCEKRPRSEGWLDWS